MKTIGFIGAGQMAQALASGIAKTNCDKGAADKVQFFISDPNAEACSAFENLIGDAAQVTKADDNQAVVAQCEIVFLAVKPQYIRDAVAGVDFAATTPLLVSIVAGVQIGQLNRLTNIDRIIRVMPNTPCLIGQGASAIAPSEEVTPSDVELIKSFLGSVGTVVEVSENLIDSVTGVSGSVPAYVYTFIEAMIDGGVLTGMPRAIARELAIQTVIGSALMVKESGEHPAVLRDRVTSPGGTTIEAMKSLEESSFRDAVMAAVFAATNRSQELG